MKKRVLILMSRTGGGHIASAQAISKKLLRQAPDGLEVEIADLLIDYLVAPINRLPGTYQSMVNRAPWLWGALWRGTSTGPASRVLSDFVRWTSRRRIAALLDRSAPDLVVSVHPLVNRLIAPVLDERVPRVPFAIVVTDLGSFHPTWFETPANAVFVPSEEAADIAVRFGQRPENVHPCGLPVRVDFERTYDRAEVRTEFGLDPDLPAALVMGGGDGIGPVLDIVEACCRKLDGGGTPRGQIVVVCGRNTALQARLSAIRWAAPVRVLGFVDRMAALMQACDLLVTKAGPGTIAEAAICGLPMLFWGFIPGQEEGNVDFVTDRGGGRLITAPDAIAAAVADLFGANATARAAMSAAVRGLARPRATADIAASLRRLVET